MHSAGESEIELHISDTESEYSVKWKSVDTTKSSEKKEIKKRKKQRELATTKVEDDALLDREIEETIQNCVEKNNLTPDSVKKILRKLVQNEHVLAICKLQEEEERRQDSESHNTEEDEDKICVPKLTRSKAKELNHVIRPIVPIKDPDEEVVSLIQEELHSDEDDEEYEPCEEDIHSDDEQSTTISDIDSQPRTPATPYMLSEYDDDSTTQFTEDGLFKIPRISNNSVTLTEEQENIARRTRSKLCLTTTAIETIESTFLPPDITTDMYDFDCDMDNEWKDFLNEFTQPFDINKDDDEDGDPEYVANDAEPMDKEELRQIKVSRKEVSDLVAELLQMSGQSDDLKNLSSVEDLFPVLDGANNVSTSAVPNTSQGSTDIVTPPGTPINRNKISRFKKIRPVVSTSESTSNDGDDELGSRIYGGDSLSQDAIAPIHFNPNSISTPKVNTASSVANENIRNDITQLPEEKLQQAPIEILSNVVLSSPQSAISFPFVISHTDGTLQQIQQPLTSSIIYFNGLYYVQTPLNMSLLHDANVIGNEDTNNTVMGPTNATATIASIEVTSDTMHTICGESNLTDDCKSVIKTKKNKFEYLNHLDPNSFPSEKFEENAIGFTDKQRLMLKQQLEIHVQMATQNFLQTFHHPLLHLKSEEYSDFLQELQALNKNSMSAFNTVNLLSAMTFCRNWKKSFLCNSKENQEYKNFVARENYLESIHKTSGVFIKKFHPRLLDAVVNSEIFIYPSLLPKIPFRKILKSDLSALEEYLIAYGLELFNELLSNEMNLYSVAKKRKPTTVKICHYISKYICTTRNSCLLYEKIRNKKKATTDINPIKYYYMHGKAPPFPKLTLNNVETQNIVAPRYQPPGSLPYVWDLYVQNMVSETGQKASLELSKQPKKTVSGLCDYYSNFSCDSDGVIALPEINTSIKWSLQVPLSDVSTHHCESVAINSTDNYNMINSNFLDYSYRPIENQVYVSDVNISLPESEATLNSKDVKSTSFNFHEQLSCDNNLFGNIMNVFDKIYHAKSHYENVRRLKLLSSVYDSTRTIDIFTNLMADVRDLSNVKIIRIPSRSYNETTGSNCSSTKVNIPRDSTKSLNGSKLGNNDCNALNFCTLVFEKMVEDNCSEFYYEFSTILNGFDTDNNTILDLYHKLESYFLPKYPELADTFLHILLPKSLVQIGKFLERWILANKSSSVEKFRIFFETQTRQFKTIYEMLNNLIDNIAVTKNLLQECVMPLVKENPLLADWYREVFSDCRNNLLRYTVAQRSFTKIMNQESDNLDYENITLGRDNEVATKIKYLTNIECTECVHILPAKLSYIVYNSLIRTTQTNRFLHSNTKTESGTTEDAANNLKPKTAVASTCVKLETITSTDNSSFDISLRLSESESEKSGKQKNHLMANKNRESNTVNGFLTNSKKSAIQTTKRMQNMNDLKAINRAITSAKKRPSISKKKTAIKKLPLREYLSTSSDTDESVILSKRRKMRNTLKSRAVDCYKCEPSPELIQPTNNITMKSSTNKSPRNVIVVNRVSPATPETTVENLPETQESTVSPTTSNKTTLQPISSPAKSNTQDNQPAIVSWTRDEDKIVLEEIRGLAEVDAVVLHGRIHKRLPNRSLEEIARRYSFLMTVLRKMKKS